MGKKYIKGKDGKFQGSIPDGNDLPGEPLELPKLSPRVSRNHPSVRLKIYDARDRFANLQELRESVNAAKKDSRKFPLFSAQRAQARDSWKNLKQQRDTLEKELSAECWRCYGTGKPMNSYGDTLEIFSSCPACNR